ERQRGGRRFFRTGGAGAVPGHEPGAQRQEPAAHRQRRPVQPAQELRARSGRWRELSTGAGSLPGQGRRQRARRHAVAARGFVLQQSHPQPPGRCRAGGGDAQRPARRRGGDRRRPRRQGSGRHGPGGTLEKNVTLAVARDLAAEINRQPGMKAALTSSGDYFIPLKQRYEIARENNADLFVSIHADSFTSDDAKGSSVWVLSSRGKTSMAARWLADGQNRSDLIGGVSLDDKNDGLAKVLLDLQQGWAMQASDEVAGNVLKALAKLGPTHRGYVERANFVVLRSPDVPSILVETAFISNPLEERRLRDPGHQKL